MYKTQNIDTDKALKALDETKLNLARKYAEEARELQKYYEGIEQGIKIAEQLFYCSNYEKEDEK